MALNICVDDIANISLYPAICADVRTSLAPANSLWGKEICDVAQIVNCLTFKELSDNTFLQTNCKMKKRARGKLDI